MLDLPTKSTFQEDREDAIRAFLLTIEPVDRRILNAANIDGYARSAARLGFVEGVAWGVLRATERNEPGVRRLASDLAEVDNA